MKDITRWVSVTVAGGFYYFGEEVQGPEGFIAIKQAAMSGGFSTSKGWPGVLRGETAVTLDRFAADDVQLFPISAVYAIHQSINLYESKNTTIR